MGGISVKITNLPTFNWLYVGMGGARQNIFNETHLVQKVVYISSNFAVVFQTMPCHISSNYAR